MGLFAGCAAEVGSPTAPEVSAIPEHVDRELLIERSPELTLLLEDTLTQEGLDLHEVQARVDATSALDPEERRRALDAIDAELSSIPRDSIAATGMEEMPPLELIDASAITPAILESCTTEARVFSSYSRASTTDVSAVNRFTGIMDARVVATAADGEVRDRIWLEHSLRADASRNSITASFNVERGFNESWAASVFSYAASGISIRLEVRDGSRVLCTDEQALRENYVPIGHAGGDVRRGAHSLSCSWERALGQSDTVSARFVVDVWGSAGGLARSEAMLRGDLTMLSSATCDARVGWCTAATQDLFAGDFDGDGTDDLLCHDRVSGTRWIDYGRDGLTDRTEWTTTRAFCVGGTQLVADVNGDGRDDFACHDGRFVHVDFADVSGRLMGANFVLLQSVCDGGGTVALGDVNGDGRADLLCHESGFVSVRRATTTGILPTVSQWVDYCRGDLRVADMNGDGRADLHCRSGGPISIDLADGSGRFGTIDSTYASSWCTHGGATYHLIDVNGDRRADAICSDTTGRLWIDTANWAGALGGTDRHHADWGFCATSSRGNVFGVNLGERHDALACQNRVSRTTELLRSAF